VQKVGDERPQFVLGMPAVCAMVVLKFRLKSTLVLLRENLIGSCFLLNEARLELLTLQEKSLYTRTEYSSGTRYLGSHGEKGMD
jgi:hypothetical protein